MQRFLVAIVILLAAILLGRDPHVQKADQFFLDWLLRNTDPTPGEPSSAFGRGDESRFCFLAKSGSADSVGTRRQQRNFTA